MTKHTRFLVAAAVGVLVLLAAYLLLKPSSPTSDTTLRFGYQPFGSNLPFFVAADQKLFEKHGVVVEPVRIISANDAASAVVRGDLVGNATVPLNVLLNIEAIDPGKLKIFMMKTTSSEGDWSDYLLVKKGSPHAALEDLHGLRVGGYPGSAQQALIRLIFKDAEVTPVELAPNLQLQALATGQVDALLTYDELAALALSEGIGEVLVENPLGRFVVDPLYGFAYVLSTEFIRTQPEDAAAVRSAMYEAADYITRHPEEARRIMAEWADVPLEIAHQVRLWSQTKAEDVDLAAVQRLADLFLEEGVVQADIDVRPLLWQP